MSLRRWLTAAAVTVVALGAARDASAFCRTTTCNEATETCEKNERGCVRSGTAVKWEKQPIEYRIYAGGSKKLNDKKMRAAIRNAFETWASVECPAGGPPSLTFKEGEDIEDDKVVGRKVAKEKFGIYFRDKEWPYKKEGADSLALTNQIYGETFGRIDYADIEINTAENEFSLSDENSEAIDFESVMIHEVGHYLGLAHAEKDKPDSIMAPIYCQSANRCQRGGIEAKRKLDEDDIDGVCGIYPPEDDDKKKKTPPSCAQSSPSGGGLAGTLGLLFVTAAIVRKRLRAS